MNTGIMVPPNVLELLVTKLCPDWCGERHPDSPASPKATVQGVNVHTQLACPLGNCPRFTVMGKVVVIAFVVLLLLVVFPMCILWGIGAVVMDSPQGRFGKRFQSHVGEEVFKRLPPLADGDWLPFSSTIVLECGVAGFVATGTHLTPSFVLRRITHPVLLVPAATTTGASVSATKRHSRYDGCVSALATTQPESLAATIIAIADIPNDDELAGALSGKVFDTGWNRSRINVSHLNFLSKFMVARAVRKRSTSGRLALLCQGAA